MIVLLASIYIYIYIIYTPNLGIEITAFVQEREQGRFKKNIKGVKGSIKGAMREQGGAMREPELLIYTPNFGFGIAIFDWEREQGCSGGSSEGAKGAAREQQGGVPRERSTMEPIMPFTLPCFTCSLRICQNVLVQRNTYIV